MSTLLTERDGMAGEWVGAEHYLDAVQTQVRDQAASQPTIVPDLFGLLGGPDLKGAACKGFTEAEIEGYFYPQPHVTVASLARARMVCFECPVMVGCLKSSLQRNERYGIWAGTSRRTRLRIRVMIASGQTTMARVLLDFALGFTSRYDQLDPDTSEESYA